MSANILCACYVPGTLLMQGYEGKQTQERTRWTALETTNHNPRLGALPQLGCWIMHVYVWLSKSRRKFSRDHICISRAFSSTWVSAIAKFLYQSCYYVLGIVLCTQWVLSDLLLRVTVWGYYFAHFKEEEVKAQRS